MAKKNSSFLKLEKQIAADERGGIMHRWRSGCELVKAKAGRRQLPAGLITDLIVEATRAGLKLSEREIQYRIRCATTYGSEAELRSAAAEWGSWRSMCDAGFPAVEVDDQADAIEEVGLAEEGDQQDPLFEIPGFKPVLKIRGRKRDLADLTVREAVEYRNMCREMHDSFGRTVTQIDSTVAAMLAGAGGDLDVNALDAYRRATETED